MKQLGAAAEVNSDVRPEQAMIHITQDQAQQFDDLGFLVLRQWIPADLVRRLHAAIDSAIEGALESAKRGSSGTDYCIVRVKDIPFLTYIDHLHRHAYPASLELAGSPQMRSIGQAFCGEDYLASYEYAVVKTRGDGERIPWHQDMIHDRTSRILNLGFYLSEATTSEGALRVIPRTQFAPQDICAIEADAKLEKISIEMSPGDVLLHDVMLAHSSESLVHQGQRQVLYFELRTLKHLQNNRRVSREWISARQHLKEMEDVAYQQRVTSGVASGPLAEAVTASTEQRYIDDVYSLPLGRESGRYCNPLGGATSHTA
jgi:ectoine hydroxylase-related dioxygenase (phytanoyl-CoA dioxygenase family)